MQNMHESYRLLPENEKFLRSKIEKSRTIVLKLGTNILNTPIQKKNKKYFQELAAVVKNLKAAGKNVLIVSSGAVGIGKTQLNLGDRLQIAEKQALASIGQSLLIEKYRAAFQKHNLQVGQILVAKSDFSSRTNYRNLTNTIHKLLEWGVVPVINENDAVTIEELRLGDNDSLSASIASLFPDSLLLLLTTVEGFMIDGKLVEHVERVPAQLLKHAGNPLPGGTGGMVTKLKAGQSLLQSSLIMAICSGWEPANIEKVLRLQFAGTWFFNRDIEKALPAKKRWVLQNRHIAARITVDRGAEQALCNKNASLLSVGIVHIQGDFLAQEVLVVRNEKNEEIAKGLAKISSAELQKNKKKVVIHKDTLVLLADA